MQRHNVPVCPDCDPAADAALSRRAFLATAGASAAAALLPETATAATTRPAAATAAGPTPRSAAETAVKALYDSFSDAQRKTVCFDWDYVHPERGLLRTHVSNIWRVSQPAVRSDFFTARQQGLVLEIFRSLFQPDWSRKLIRQLKDDSDGAEWGTHQSIAVFGRPGQDKFEFVMTGRHLTIRADGNSEARVAFGGPIFHGHAASGSNEQVGHPGNIFWPQAIAANRVYRMLDGKQRARALVGGNLPRESAVDFRRAEGDRPGIPLRELASNQREEVEKVLAVMLEPYRDEDRAEVTACLKKQGGLDACNLAFYKDGDLGDDGEWDNWRLEGPALAWYFRGYPHVHIWIHVADDPAAKLNARG